MAETRSASRGVGAHEGGSHGAGIELESLSKRYPGSPRPSVDDVSLRIEAGETVVLVGPPGCGKSTTLKMINRLIEPSGGRIRIDGEDVTGIDPVRLRRKVGYATRSSGLFPHMTVARNIALVPRTAGWPKARIRDRVEEMLGLVGLDPGTFHGRYPHQLSGGQRQRVGVARALAADPPVLLMDEPFGGLDPATRGHLQDELIRLQGELRKSPSPCWSTGWRRWGRCCCGRGGWRGEEDDRQLQEDDRQWQREPQLQRNPCIDFFARIPLHA